MIKPADAPGTSILTTSDFCNDRCRRDEGDIDNDGNTQEYFRGKHKSIDFDLIAPPGSFWEFVWEAGNYPAGAMMSGIVTEVGYANGKGNYVCIKNLCIPNCTLCYLHLDKIAEKIKVGESVRAGDYIGDVGRSGLSANHGIHLHVEVHAGDHHGELINPRCYFRNPIYPTASGNWDNTNCPEPPIAETESNMTVGTSIDPNDKAGSLGTGIQHFVSTKRPLLYTIFFENLPSATLPAQIVVIQDTLNATKVDFKTLSLSTITFGKYVVTPSQGLRQFSTDVDLRPADSLIVRINAQLDTTIGVLSWRFESIDPLTGQPTTDPLAGFLPPNVNPPEGDGSVSFTIMSRNDLPTRTEIRNKASIVFDTNPAIVTPTWLNTIDEGKPISRVLPFTTAPNSAEFLVHWSGSDNGSGVRDYSVYVSEDDGEFAPWLSSTNDTAATYNGIIGKKYGFYSIARDSVGNLEAPKDTADAVVTIITGVKESPAEIPKEYALSQSYPNPFNPTTVIEYALPVASTVTLKIYDISGREVKTLVDKIQEAGYKTVEWDSRNNAGIRVASGVYFYRIEVTKVGSQDKSFVQVRRMLLLK
ncbi:MAG: DUF7619 domain-containing protein [bacterium]